MKRNFLTDNIRQLIITPENWDVILPEKSNMPGNKKDLSTEDSQSHAHREIMLALAGTCTYGFDGDYYQCTPGTLFLINHNVEHGYHNLSETEQLLHLWTYTLEDNSIAIRCIAINHGNMQVLSSAILPPTNGLDLELFWNRLDEASTQKEQAHRLQFLKLAIALRFGQFLESTELSRGQYHLLVVESVLARIRTNFKNGINVAQLAKSFGYTRFHFARLFRKITGETIQDYINQCRLKELKRLQERNLSQKEIAIQLGFENPRSYYKWKQKHLSNKL
jgi:YesN/AraC family two-component response regulator